MVDAGRNELIAKHADIARRIALKMARRCPHWVAREDLVAAGMLGLTEAAARYDAKRAEPFLPFAEPRIRGAILDELRRGDLLPRRMRQLARRLEATKRGLEHAGAGTSAQEVATAMGVSLATYHANLAALLHHHVESIEGACMTLVDEASRPLDEQVERSHELARVRRALDHMERRDVTLLGLHYLEELTFQQIAETLKITPSRACQLLWRAVARLREKLGAAAAPELMHAA